VDGVHYLDTRYGPGVHDTYTRMIAEKGVEAAKGYLNELAEMRLS
jgi:hypothetical protein